MIDESTMKVRDHFWMKVVVYLSTQSIAFIKAYCMKLKSVSKKPLLLILFTTLFGSLNELTWCEFPIWTFLLTKKATQQKIIIEFR